jgi:hypothetical protein
MNFSAKIFYNFFFICLIACRERSSLLATKELSNYPSGSAVEYSDGHFFLIGDDATYVLLLDEKLEPVDTIQLYENNEARIPKATKPDLEAATLIVQNDTTKLLLVGSGSVKPYRNTCWLINEVTKEKKEIKLDTFYHRLTGSGIEDLNIEAAAATSKGIILVSRGNKAHPRNYIVFTSMDFWNDQTGAPIKISQTTAGTDTSFFNGISGIAYSTRHDRLWLTVSTENTYSSFTDGAIGKSYLWVIDSISSKTSMAEIRPGRIIDLDSLDGHFVGHKIESACIITEKGAFTELLLVSDNDDGRTGLYRLKVVL